MNIEVSLTYSSLAGKSTKGWFTRLRRKPWLPVLRSSLLRRMDEAVEECAAGVLRPVGRSLWAACRSLGEGGHAPGLRSRGYFGGVGSAGFAEEIRGTTAVKPWGSTEMADALPELTWRQLLNALMRLHSHEIVTLSALRFDYQVKLRKRKRPVLGTTDSVRSPVGGHPDPGGTRSVTLSRARRDAGGGAGRMKVL
jgi:hypothetical protein